METADLKLVLLGDMATGKTCLVQRFLHETWTENPLSTIGASFAVKKMDAEGRSCVLGIWDTAGQERFDSLSSFYCRGARAAVICFDLTNRVRPRPPPPARSPRRTPHTAPPGRRRSTA
jgi:small GTP-binding protein